MAVAFTAAAGRQGGELPEAWGALGRQPPCQALQAVRPELAGARLALTGVLRHASVVGPQGVARVPCRRHLLAPPRGRHVAELVEGPRQGFEDPCQPGQGADRRQDRRGLGPLGAPPLPRALQAARTGSRSRWPAAWGSKRQRPSCTSVKSQPGSGSARLRADFPSRPQRPASAGWRSVSPAIDGLTTTQAKRQGATSPGRPCGGGSTAKRGSSSRVPNSARRSAERWPWGQAACTAAAVAAGTGAHKDRY